ncbi:unnamed protein product, partial [Effrenium voratum]
VDARGLADAAAFGVTISAVRWQQALQLLAAAERRRLHSQPCCGAALQACASKAVWRQSLAILSAMKAACMVPNLATYSIAPDRRSFTWGGFFFFCKSTCLLVVGVFFFL